MLANIVASAKKATGRAGIMGSISLDYLVVAGGGSGGSGSKFNAAGGGGGAGGVLQGAVSISVGDTYALTVGNGGATAAPFALGNNGTNSVFGTLAAVGGGAGASHTVEGQSPNNIAGSAGGSGGGGSGSTALGGTGGAGGAGTSGQGNSGSAGANDQPLSGGGGGGAGTAGVAAATGSGARAGSGGAGISSSITGTPTFYGGGGGGGVYNYFGSPYIGALPGLGGTGGGGNGSGNTSTAGANGTANTGGGGGGGATNDPNGIPSGTNGGAGGSGIVVLRCSSAFEIAEASGLNYSSVLSGGYRIYSFYSGTGNVTFQFANTDQFFSSVSLLLSMNGPNGSTTFTDSGPNALVVTATSATISTAQSKYGGTSGYFNGSTGYLSLTGNSTFQFGTGDFTIEAWVFIAADAANQQTFLDTRGSASAAPLTFGIYQSNLAFYDGTMRQTSATVTTGQWYHFAACRSGGTLRLFIDGVSSYSASNTTNITTGANSIYIGRGFDGAGYYTNGYIDDLRVSRFARYVSNFTPPTTALPTIAPSMVGDPFYSAVSLVLSMDGTDGSTTFKDSGPNALTVTPSGNTQLKSTVSKFGGSSAYFDGTGDYLSVAANAAIELSSSDFTIEFWIRPAPKTNAVDAAFGYSNYACMFYHDGVNWTLELSSTGVSNQLVISSPVTLNSWQHIAIVRYGNSIVVYKDGVSSATGTFSGTVATSGRTLRIGDNGNSQNINGYIDDFRISLFARYTSTFLPPAALPTTASSTVGDPYYSAVSLLLSMDGTNGSTTFTDFSLNALTVTAVGNAQISTTQSKYGGASGYFDGSGDYLDMSGTGVATAFGLGDFTIEFWYYPLSVSVQQNLVDKIGSASNAIYMSSAGVLKYYVGADRITGATLSANTWYHIALVRYSGVTKLYVNGVQSGASYNDTNDYVLNTGSPRIGAAFNNTVSVNGYLDDLRISRFARYVSTFTPPTAALPTTASSTPADPYYGYTSLLLNMDGSSGSTNFVDSGPNALAVTAVGNAQVSTSQSKYGGASGYFDGSGDYLDIPYGNSLNITTDYTIEFWMRADSVTGYAPIFTITSATTSFFGGIYVVRNGSAITFETRPADGSGSSVIAITGGSISTNIWYHVAASVSGNSARLFINGVQIGSTTTFTTRTFTPTGARIGRFANNFISGLVDFAGYIDDLRVTKYARYTAAFTPPTAALPTTVSSTVADPYYGYTSLLLHMDGTNGSTTFTDSGPNALAVTAAANAQISTTQNKYGSASGYFDGTGDSLTIPANTALALGAGDYTIEGWFYSLTTGTSLRGMIDFRTAATGTNGLMLRENDGGFLVYLNNATILSTTTGRVANQWQHVALVRKGTTVTLYVDGVSQTTATSSTNLTDNIMRISGFVDTQSDPYAYNGYIDDLRITKYARYTAAFTPPTQAHLEFAAGTDRYFSNVSLLLHMNGTNGSTKFTDSSSNSRTITTVGNAQISTTQYKFSGSSAYFDGTGDYLSLSGGMPSGTGTAFTLECWIRLDDLADYRAITRTAGGLDIGVQTNGLIGCDQTQVGIIANSAAGVITAGTWYHIAVTRDTSNNYKIYVNGTQVASGTNSFTVTAATTIGYSAYSGSHYFKGYIDDFRVTNVLRYTAAFPLPTVALTDIYNPYTVADPYFSSVSLLLHMDGANGSTTFADDSANALALTAVGNAQISTTQSKYGGASGAFDGTGDYLSIPDSSAPVLGSSDWTIEAWIYVSVAKNFNCFYAKRQPGGYGLAVQVDGSNNLTISASTTGSSWALAGSSLGGGYTAGSWIHVAVVRSGNTITGYKDGVSTGTQTLSGTIWPSTGYAAAVASGLAGDTSQDFNGYIDDLRITKYARYTAAFTPPTQALPNMYNPYTTLPVSGAALWLDASQQNTIFTDAGTTPVTTSGQSVYQWNDLSGNNRHAIQATSGNRPTWVAPANARNNLGALGFNASQWIDLASNTAIEFGTSDFTVEAWIKPAGFGGANTAVISCGNNGFLLYITPAGILRVGQYGTADFGTSPAIPTTSWTHVAISRSGTSLKVFFNGVLNQTFTDTFNYSGSQTARIGWDATIGNGFSKYNGQIQNLVVYKGQALYTANFTPWTS